MFRQLISIFRKPKMSPLEKEVTRLIRKKGYGPESADLSASEQAELDCYLLEVRKQMGQSLAAPNDPDLILRERKWKPQAQALKDRQDAIAHHDQFHQEASQSLRSYKHYWG